jgi:histidinol phosphatase-like PHP family hydrolase
MHTLNSDGDLLPIELIRRAAASDHRAVAITDHASFSNLDEVIRASARDCRKAEAWGIEAIPGVELTHVPVKYIDDAVRKSRKAGAQIVVVHGETPVEPVERGTNYEALSNPEVDILAHPGMLTIDEAELAAKNEVYLEISCRKGHSLANGHVAVMGGQGGASGEHRCSRARRPQHHGVRQHCCPRVRARPGRGQGGAGLESRSSSQEDRSEVAERIKKPPLITRSSAP